jgi:peptidoglycan hydrolase CwlO-like protein
MPVKKTKKELSGGALLKEYTKEVKNHIGVMREDFDAKVKIIGEQYTSLNNNVGSLGSKFDSLDEKFDKLDNKVDRNTEMLGQVMVDVNQIKHDLKRKVDYDEFARLEKRVRLLEVRGHK